MECVPTFPTKIQLNVAKYIIHGSYGIIKTYLQQVFPQIQLELQV